MLDEDYHFLCRCEACSLEGKHPVDYRITCKMCCFCESGSFVYFFSVCQNCIPFWKRQLRYSSAIQTKEFWNLNTDKRFLKIEICFLFSDNFIPPKDMRGLSVYCQKCQDDKEVQEYVMGVVNDVSISDYYP